MTTIVARGLSVPVQQMPHADGLPLPSYQTSGSAGLDLTAALPLNKPIRLAAGARALIPTGLMIALPAGHEAQVRPRSGLALKQGLTVLNSPGTIDSDYRGEIQVILINLSRETAVISRGDRIAQMVVAPVTQVQLRAATALTSTARGSGGFGSTGKVAVTPKPNQKTAKGGSGAPRKARSEAAPIRPVKKSSKVANKGVRSKAIATGTSKQVRRAR